MELSLIEFIINNISKILIQKSIKWQKEKPLCDLKLWDLHENTCGHIAVQGLDTVDLVEKIGSPLLVVNQHKLLNDAHEIQNSMAPAPPGSMVLYSYKTNCIPGILKELHDIGVGAEVISPYELWLAERLKVPGEKMVYNGVNKTIESIKRAIELDILSINIDHHKEVERIYTVAKKLGKKANVGVRLSFVPKSQFGLEIETGEALKVCKKIAKLSDYLNLVCVHFNVTSNAHTSTTHKNCAQRAINFIKQIKENTGLVVSFLDIGGGFGVPSTKNMSGKEYGIYRLFGCLPKPPIPSDFQPIRAFMSEVIDAVKVSCSNLGIEIPKIIIEPGRYITSRSEFLLSKVLSIKNKKNGTRFAITDAGRLSLTFPCDFEYHEVFVANKFSKNRSSLFHVMGRICTSADWMFKNKYLPELKSGDLLAIMDAGAYFSSYSTNFAFPRPPVIMVSNGKVYFIRAKESFEHLIALDTINAIKDNKNIINN